MSIFNQIGKSLGHMFGGTFGAAGGYQGTGAAAPTAATIVPGTDAAQVQASNSNAANGFAAQQDLWNALQAQQGLQAQVGGLGSQAALLNQLSGYNGAANLNSALMAQQGIYGQQQALANQYGDIAAGRGPNPAQAMLAQQTGSNVANQAAMMAGQRGAGANVGLMARQAGQQGAATQQQAVGQAASMQAQQSLAALQAQAAQQQAMGQTQQNIAGLGAQQVGMTAQQQQAYNAQANALANQQIQGTTTMAQGAQSEQQILQNALNAQNAQNVSMQGNLNAGNTSLAQTTLQGRQGVMGGLLSGAGAAMGMAKGGTVGHYDEGGTVAPIAPVGAGAPAASGAQSSFGKFLQNWSSNPIGSSNQPLEEMGNQSPGGQALNQGTQDFVKGLGSMLKAAPTTPASPVTAYVGPDVPNLGAASVMMSSQGGLAERGGHVNAKKNSQKAQKSGDSYSNDKIPALLSEGEVVIPRSIMQSKDPVKASADFVSKVLAKRKAS